MSGQQTCNADGPSLYVCTEPTGHGGDHVARGSNPLVRWPNAAAPREGEPGDAVGEPWVQVLADAHEAITTAITNEDGLDGGEGEAILERIEAALADDGPTSITAWCSRAVAAAQRWQRGAIKKAVYALGNRVHADVAAEYRNGYRDAIYDVAAAIRSDTGEAPNDG